MIDTTVKKTLYAIKCFFQIIAHNFLYIIRLNKNTEKNNNKRKEIQETQYRSLYSPYDLIR